MIKIYDNNKNNNNNYNNNINNNNMNNKVSPEGDLPVVKVLSSVFQHSPGAAGVSKADSPQTYKQIYPSLRTILVAVGWRLLVSG